MSRKTLIPLSKAQKLYGIEKTTFIRPRYVPEGSCEWCGNLLQNKRRKSCCSEDCNKNFLNATCAVMYANSGSAGGYRNHMFRRDNYTCQKCGTFHAYINENGIPVPTTDGELDLHHIKPVSQGGNDAPDNLITWCRDCHKEWHRQYGVDY